jgi:type I restriction enzyme S subunit
MREGWEIKKLEEVADIINGGTPKTGNKEFWDGDIFWITPADLGKLKKPTVSDTPRKISRLGLEKSSAKLFDKNSVILSTRAPIGHLAINEVPMCTNQGCRGIVPSKNLDTWFLYYFLKSNVELLDSLGTGATFKELSTKALGGVQFPLPPLPEQQRIVAILDECFAALEKTKANAEQNLKNAKELFESYLQGVFENKGEGWEVYTVKECVENGFIYKPLDGNHGEIHPTKSDFVPSGVPFVMSRDMKGGGIDENNCYFITEKQAKTLRTGFAKDGDVLISHKGTIGEVSIIKTEKDFLVLTPQITFYRIKNIDKLYNKYLYYYFLNNVFQKSMNLIAQGGSTRAYIGITKQLELSITIAPLKEQQTIVRQLDALRAETQRLEAVYQQKLADLEELKKSILQKAFAGELTAKSIAS